MIRHPEREGVVEQRQGLERRGGAAATRRGSGGIGAIERVKERIAATAGPEAVDGTAIELGADGIDGVVVLSRFVDVGPKIHVAGAAALFVELSGDQKHR